VHGIDSLTILALGLVLGVRHAADADHVIAVTTIVARQRSARAAALIGAMWGVGHTLTILVVGGGIILFNWVIPPRAALAMELAVAVMLIVLGVGNLRYSSGPMGRLAVRMFRRLGAGCAPAPARRDARSGTCSYLRSDTHSHAGSHAGLHARSDPHSHAQSNVRSDARPPAHADAPNSHTHSHAHAHGDYVHTHPHRHDPESHPHAADATPLARLDRKFGGIPLYRLARPLVVGTVHGLAGSAAIALLVLSTIRTPAWSVLYLVVFGAGTIVGMMLITLVIALPFARRERPAGGLRMASGLISLGFGCLLTYQIGFVDGLFTAYPR
jgi:hypothetical protein